MTFERTAEYDAFGPWILMIDEPETVPPLYRKYEHQLTSALMKFKIPRQIERRDANPKMNLYDAVVAIFENNLLYVKREGDRTAERSVDLDAIQMMTNERCLLSGLLTLSTGEESIEIPYNTVSAPIIDKAVGLIRKLRGKGEAGPEIPPLQYDMETMEFAFYNIVKSVISADPDAFVVAYQPNFSVKRKIWSGHPILSLLPFREKITSSFVLLYDRSELVAIERSYSDRQKSTDEYRYTNFYVQMKGIRKVELLDIRENDDSVSLSITGGVDTIALNYHRDNGLMEAIYHVLSGFSASFRG